MTKKRVAVLLTFALLSFSLLFAGCNKRDNSVETLEIYVANFGYGYEWLQPLMDDFAKQDWVKEKYPNLKFEEVSKNSERTYAVDQIKSGKTTVDLFISCSSGADSFESKDSKGNPYFEELTDVYESEVPGEGVLFKDKMQDEFLTMSTYETYGGEYTYFCVPWVTGMQGMVYNRTMFEEYGWEVPNTTDDLLVLCDEIVADGEVPFIFTSKENYWTCMMFLLWWGQYEGADNYANFYQGLVCTNPDAPEDEREYDYSNEVFAQMGRLRSLETISSLIHADNPKNYCHENVNTLQFTQAQSKFLTREGAMMPNGDWLEAEMRKVSTSGAITDVFTFMKTPVISSIIEKCTTIPDNDTLSKVIDAIDAGEESYGQVSAEDFAKVKEARKIVLPVGNHTIMIPAYATAKEVAKDFVRYLATDGANNVFMEYSNGASMPFNYDVETEDPELYNSLAQIQKDRISLCKGATYLLNENTYKTVYYGGIARVSQGRTVVEALFTAQNEKDRMSAREIYDAEIAYWDDVRFANVLTNSGITN